MTTYMPYAAMVLIQVAYGGSNILMKIAIEKGLNQLVFVVYRHIIAMLLLSPLAYMLERKQRPALSFSVVMRIVLLSSLGTTIHLNVYYAGLAYTTPTVASALSNVIPSLTFILAVLLRTERVNIWSARGQAKVIGTLSYIGGSLVFTFWKGRSIFNFFMHKPLIEIYQNTNKISKSRHIEENWIKGSAFILTSYMAHSPGRGLQIISSSTLYECPDLFHCIVAIFYTCAFSRNKWNHVEAGMRHIALNYSLLWGCDIWISLLSTNVVYQQERTSICSKISPLLLLVVGIFSTIAFAEQIHLGSLVGGSFIILGLYCVLWGKKADNIAQETCENSINKNNNQKQEETYVIAAE